jgi:heme A synthase
MRPLDRMRRLAWGLLGMLVLENLLGIFANLYVTLPSSNAIQSIFTSYPVLALHVVLAFVMVAAAAFLVVFAHRNGYRRFRNLGALEVVFLAVAIQEGFAYAATLDSAFSLGMDVAFLLAVIVDVRLLTLLAGGSDPPPTAGAPTAL